MSFFELLRCELRAIFTNPAILLTVFGGVVFYSFLYPLPYANQIPREQRIVVANLDENQLSRRLERMVDATPQVHIAARTYSLEEAQRIFFEQRMAGLLVIPEHFYRDLLLGRQPTLSYGGDASYFLIYGTVLQGLAAAGETLAAQVKIKKMIGSGQALALAKQQYTAMHLNLRSVFNPTGGYVNYVIPAVFILILHQTLIIAAGILGGGQNEKNAEGAPGYWRDAAPLQLLVARSSIFVLVYWLLCMYYFGFSFSFYNIARHAGFAELNLVILPFLLGAAFLGICLGLILPRRELATLLVLLSSMPLVFTSGFIWPPEAIPALLRDLAQFIPVVPATKMFLGLNQMGGEFSSLQTHWYQMWLCVLLYGLLAWLLLHVQRRRCAAKPPEGKESGQKEVVERAR